MNLQQESIARRSAKRLAEYIDPHLPQQVDTELSLGEKEKPLEKYGVELALIVAIAALIIQISQFALDVYLSRKRKQQTPDENALKELIRSELKEISTLTEIQKDHVAQIVAQETLKTQS